MKNNDIKKTHKIFTLTDYDLEEEYLRKMHNDGWELSRPAHYTQTFRKTEPKDVVYKIDFLDNTDDFSAYKKLYEDYGWEYIGMVNNFTYFRKDAEGISDEDADIFSDNQSRFDMIKKIFRRKLMPLLTIFFCCVLTNFMNAFRSYSDTYGKIWLGVAGALVIVYIYAFVRFAAGYFRIKNKLTGRAVK